MSTCTKMKRVLNCSLLCRSRIRSLALQKDGVRNMGILDKFQLKKNLEKKAMREAGLDVDKEKRIPFSKRINEDGTRTIRPSDGYITVDIYKNKMQRSSFERIRPYTPPEDVVETMKRIVQEVCGPSDDWMSLSLDNRQIKFKLLTRCLKEFDHKMQHMDLDDIKTVEDAVKFFRKPVKSI